LQTKKIKSRRKKVMETRRIIAIEATKVVVVEEMANAETEFAVVVAATVMINIQEMDPVQMMIVLFMADISGVSAIRILEETTMILQEEVAEMDKDVVTLILAMEIMVVEEEAEVVDTMTLVITRTMRIIMSKMHRNKELRMLAKEPISKMLHQNTII
jgi:hypothetical protein